MSKIEYLLDAYEEAIIDLAVRWISDEPRDSQNIAKRLRDVDVAREEIVQYVEDLEGENG